MGLVKVYVSAVLLEDMYDVTPPIASKAPSSSRTKSYLKGIDFTLSCFSSFDCNFLIETHAVKD